MAQESSHRYSLIIFFGFEYNGSERGLTLHTKFGITFKLTGTPTFDAIFYKAVISHPSITNPVLKKSYIEHTEEATSHFGLLSHCVLTFDKDWELIPGIWNLRIFYHYKLLAEKEFEVFLPQE